MNIANFVLIRLKSSFLSDQENPRSQCWYALGHNCKLDKTISRMCERAGIPGYKTIHSLCATNATWFYQAGVDEQLIME